MDGLPFLNFLPAGFALLNGEAHASGYIAPIGSELRVCLQFDEAAVCFAVPVIPIGLGVQWWCWLSSFFGM